MSNSLNDYHRYPLLAHGLAKIRKNTLLRFFHAGDQISEEQLNAKIRGAIAQDPRWFLETKTVQ